MTNNVLSFEAKKTEVKTKSMDLLVSANIYLDSDDMYQVNMEIGDYSNEEVFNALMGVAMRYATDEGLADVALGPKDFEYDDDVDDT